MSEEDLPHSELTRKIIGCLFDAFKSLGYGYQEKYYQRAFEIQLKKNNLSYKRELKHTIKVDNRIVGRYFVDFVVNEKIAIELKIANDFYQTHINQLLAYLKSFKIPVGLLARVTPQG